MPDENGGTRPPDQSPPNSSPVEQRPMSNSSAKRTKNEEETTKELAQDVHWITHATFWSQVGLGIIGLIALWIYHGQLVAMQGQLDQMNKQLPEIQKSANAASRSADTSAQTMRLDERARIDLKYPAIPMNVGSRITVPLVIENTGKTEAKKLEGTIAVTITKVNAVPDFTYKRGYYSWNSGYLPQGVAATTYWNALDRKTRDDLILTASMNESIRSGEEVITINGRIEYDDIFHVHHWVTFCQQGGGSPNGMQVSGTKECAAYEQTDENQ